METVTTKLHKYKCITCDKIYASYVHLPTECYYYHKTKEIKNG